MLRGGAVKRCILLLLFKTCLEIALLRKGPDALPRSRLVLLAMLAAYSIPVFVDRALPAVGPRPPFTLSIAVIVFGALMYALALRVAGFPERTTQTLSAVFGASALLYGMDVLLSLPGVAIGTEPIALSVLRLCLLAWSLMVDVFIISKALERPRIVAAAFVLCIVFAQYFVLIASLGGN